MDNSLSISSGLRNTTKSQPNLTLLKQDFVRPQIPKLKIYARGANASLPGGLY